MNLPRQPFFLGTECVKKPGAGGDPELRFCIPEIAVIIYHADADGAAHDVAQGDGKQIAEEHAAGGQVADPYPDPVPEHLSHRDPFLKKRDGHEAVACEQLCTGKEHHGKTGGENARPHQLSYRSLADGYGSRRGSHAAESDERTGQNAEKDHFRNG